MKYVKTEERHTAVDPLEPLYLAAPLQTVLEQGELDFLDVLGVAVGKADAVTTEFLKVEAVVEQEAGEAKMKRTWLLARHVRILHVLALALQPLVEGEFGCEPAPKLRLGDLREARHGRGDAAGELADGRHGANGGVEPREG
eukprot:gene34654-biopygen35014